jgi:restriction system protein
VLLTLYNCFLEDDTPALQSVVFNGWVTGINKSTGQEFTSCILSVQASRKEFEAINLLRVDPKECIKSLKGLVAGPLSQMAPVRPIMDLDTQDKRFVESREVLANLNATDNLATMDWEAFEHLVRELFSKVFAGYGSEVRVTQASRDGGVDAIAFDPDPIRGGKFVIQAKRYNRVVPVSAVRDLYGTMINEGAAKGILVTTSYFGSDSREFVKDKPISLIDGSNLVYMLGEYGYNVRNELQ